jgi:hypothetical protein
MERASIYARSIGWNGGLLDDILPAMLLLGLLPPTPQHGILGFHVDDSWTAGALADLTSTLATAYVGLSKIDFPYAD